MLQRIGNYFYERRKGLITAAGVSGTVYMAGKYISERIEEMREQAIQMQRARENLRRRFEQNQDDVMFTIMAHLPTLSRGIVEGMDVESVTRELQVRSRRTRAGSSSRRLGGSNGSGNGGGREPSPNPPTSESSLASSVEFLSPNVHNNGRDNGNHDNARARAASMSTDPLSTVTESSGLAGDESVINAPSISSQSWADEFSTQLSGTGPVLAIPSAPSSSGREPTLISPISNVTGTGMTSSFMSDSLASSISDREPGRSRTMHSDDEKEVSSLNTKSKAELWQEVKILTFTRTLTIIYSSTLLALLTTLQLNIMGRSKYVQSVKQLLQEEKMRELRHFNASLSSLLFSGFTLDDELLDSNQSEEDDPDYITPEAERKFLTLSWWLLYMGWKDIGERVRRSVEEVFEGVSLKTRLGSKDLYRLICDVRRRVEHEITYEGTERRINFLSSIIPPSPETLSLCFSEGGVPGYRSSDLITHSYSHLYSQPHPQSPSNPNIQTSTVPQPSSSQAPALPPISSSSLHTLSHSPSHPHSSRTSPPPASHSQSHSYSSRRPDPESDKVFARLLAELRVTAASPAFGAVLEVSLDRDTEVMFDGLKRSLFREGEVEGEAGSEGGGGGGGGMEVEVEKPRLANMLPGLAKWAHNALNTVPNELVDSVVGLKETTALAAIIYSSYDYPVSQ